MHKQNGNSLWIAGLLHMQFMGRGYGDAVSLIGADGGKCFAHGALVPWADDTEYVQINIDNPDWLDYFLPFIPMDKALL
jgi:hypothetical protein